MDSTLITHALSASQSTSNLAMFHDESSYVEEIFLYLDQAVAESTLTAPKLNAKHVEVVKELLERWPSSVRFPRMSRLLDFGPPGTSN